MDGQLPEQMTMNNSPDPLSYFVQRFMEMPDSTSAVFERETQTYGDLCRAISSDCQALTERDVGIGSVLLTTGSFSLRHLSLFFASAKLGAVVVPLPEIRESEVQKCGGIANATHRVSVAPNGSWTLEATGEVVSNLLLKRFLNRRESGLVVFTSGSTGEKKGILHSVPRLLRKFTLRRKALKTLSFLKLDHLGGINTVLHALSNVGTIVFPRGRSVDEICGLIERYRLALLPTTPSFLNLLLLSDTCRRYDLSSLELITYGTEVMPEHTLKLLHRAFPNVNLQQTYGLSELGVLRSKSLESESPWVKVGGEGFETKVIEDRLWVRAQSAMEGYLNHPTPFSQDGWMDTGDRVETRGEYIKFLGRESDIINVAGEKVFPSEVENVLLTLPNVKDAMVSAEPNQLLGNIVTAQIVLCDHEAEDEARARIRQGCRQALRPFMIPVKLGFVSALRYTDRYKKLRAPSKPTDALAG
jgi:long-chain acyl-CoA synthetase